MEAEVGGINAPQSASSRKPHSLVRHRFRERGKLTWLSEFIERFVLPVDAILLF